MSMSEICIAQIAVRKTTVIERKGCERQKGEVTTAESTAA